MEAIRTSFPNILVASDLFSVFLVCNRSGRNPIGLVDVPRIWHLTSPVILIAARRIRAVLSTHADLFHFSEALFRG